MGIFPSILDPTQQRLDEGRYLHTGRGTKALQRRLARQLTAWAGLARPDIPRTEMRTHVAIPTHGGAVSHGCVHSWERAGASSTFGHREHLPQLIPRTRTVHTYTRQLPVLYSTYTSGLCDFFLIATWFLNFHLAWWMEPRDCLSLKCRWLLFCNLVSYSVCPRSSDPFYIVTYYIKWVTTSWKDGSQLYFTENFLK